MATDDAAAAAAAERKSKLRRSKSYQDKGNRLESNSHRSKVRAGGSVRERKSSSIRTHSHRHGKDSDRVRSKSMVSDRVASKSMGTAKDRTSKTDQLRSVSEGRRRNAMQHKLKEMKNLEGSTAKAIVLQADRREDSIVACRALFDRIDADGSGTLDRNEIAMLATKMVHRPAHWLCHTLTKVPATAESDSNVFC